MAELTPEIVADVVETCKKGADEASEAIGRALDAAGVKVAIGEPGNVDLKALPDDMAGPGLAVVMMVGEAAVLALLPEGSGLVPSWCADPDPTGQSKLTTLAQELGMILLPEAFMPDDFKAGWVKNLSGALARGCVADSAALVPLELSHESKTGTLSLVWPAAKPAAVLGAGAAKPKPAEQPKPRPEPTPRAQPSATRPKQSPAPRKAASLENLPPYSHSLLKIKVPVVVTLAQKRQPIGRIVELGPGSIIQFEKSCEEMLDLDIGERHVARGEAVKVGDKFGLRITSMVLPDERFEPVTTGQ